MDYLSWETIARVFIGFMLILSSSYSDGYTDPRDVFAVNSLYASLGYPLLPGWVPNGGDPCTEAWQGIECVNSNITGLILNGANLGGVLSDNLGFFSSIMIINLSNNRIGGSIPSSLPLTTRNLFLSANQFVGSIPSSLSTLGQLTDVSLNNNLLTGEIPDAFQALPSLINMDVSDNNLSGQLPPSMGNLSAMASLHMQNNQLTGVLNVLQDLPALIDLNIESNLFSGPIPERLLTIPNFKINIRTGRMSKQKDDVETDSEKMGMISTNKEDHEMDMMGMKKVIVKPNVLTEATRVPPVAKALNLPPSVRSFTIASLQQYTNSFSQENFIGQGMLGSVYRAELPDGKVLAVKKFSSEALIHHKDDQFFQLVSSVYKLRHANVVELVGYCAEHEQRLLISDYCSCGTLYDALHSDNENNKRLSWNARVRISLGAARALEYLHEVCQPPVVHRNFKSANILLDDEISVHVSDCGLAPLLSSGSVSQLPEQLSAKGYNAPEFEWGIYTYQSDVFSFGVVMLELLTGRKAYDRLQPRGEQFLVRWAIPQLHDFDALSKMVDPSLIGAYPAKSLSRYADIISLCVQAEPEFRPPMSEIVQNLVHLIQRESLNKKTYED
ncbi:hypothetical protein MKX01_011994 [Papaver californicum]|nr:hypothetical protein MKX01_011994 [Papaver californicum]